MVFWWLNLGDTLNPKPRFFHSSSDPNNGDSYMENQMNTVNITQKIQINGHVLGTILDDKSDPDDHC